MIALRSVMKLQAPLFILSLMAAFVSPLLASGHGAEQGLEIWPFFLSAGIGAVSLFAVFRGQLEKLRHIQSSNESTAPSSSHWPVVALVATTGSVLAFLYGILGTTAVLGPN